MLKLWSDVILNQTVTSGATVYTSIVPAARSNGDVALEIISSAGTLAITQQCSMDGKTWYDPQDGAGNALGAVIAAMTVGSKYIVPSAVVAPYIRYKLVESTAETIVKIKLIFSEETS